MKVVEADVNVLPGVGLVILAAEMVNAPLDAEANCGAQKCGRMENRKNTRADIKQ